MQDRFLFRGKDIYDKKWMIGSLWHDFGIPYISFVEENSCGQGFKIDPATIGQCTGLKDKNGKLIFEGDKLYDSDWECEGVVVWSNEHLSWMLRDGGSGEFLQEFITHEKTMKADFSVIIGNIHDSPVPTI